MKFQIEAGKLVKCVREDEYDRYEIAIPDEVTSIECRFPNNIFSFHIPASVTHINHSAFILCNYIKTINITESSNENHRNFSCNDGFFIIDNKLVRYVGFNEHVKIPDNVVEICYDAFSYNKTIRSVVMSNNVRIIQSYVFFQCERLESVVLSDSINEIPWAAFSGCQKLITVNMPDHLKIISENSFENCTSLTDLIIPPDVQNINAYAFQNCINLTNISISDSVTTIGEGSLNDTKWFKDYTRKYEGDFVVINGILVAYKGECFDIDRIVIPENICDISNAVFEEYKNLSTVNIRGYDYKYNDTEIPIEYLISFVLKEDYEASMIQPCDIILQMVSAGVESAIKYVKEHLGVFYDYADNLDDDRLRKLV